MKQNTKIEIKKLTIAAMLLALGLILPSITMNIPKIGNMLLPMHIPVLLCGCICGWQYGLCVGALTPILRFAIFMPQFLIPKGIPMMFELAAYGLIMALLIKFLPNKIQSVYISLIGAMIGGRLIWAICKYVLCTFVLNTPFTLKIFITEAFVTAIPGIIIQIILIPSIYIILNKSKLIPVH